MVKAFVGPTGGLIVDLMIKNGMSVRNARRLIFTIGTYDCFKLCITDTK